MPATTRPLFEQLDSWLKEIDTTKSAAAPASSNKTAGTKQAAPSGMGKTTHPSESVDNNTHPEQTGSRYEENAADVKKDVPGTPVDSTDPKSGGDQDSKQFNIGTNQSSVGEDPSVEDDYKGDKDDPGTSHPADAESVGEKYSSMNLKSLLKAAENKAHTLLADLANGVTQPTEGQTVQQKAAAVKAAQPAATAPVTPAPAASAAASYDAATLAVETEKQAAEFIAQTIRDADLDADLVGAFVHSYQQNRMKKAADESGEGEDHSDKDSGGEGGGDAGGAPPTDDGSGAGVMPPPGAGGGGDVLSALGAGAGGPPGAGAMPPDVAGGAGAGGPGGPGGMSQEQALQELAMALQELGISPEELAQMAQQGGAGGGPGGAPGGGLPPGGGMPPAGPPPEAAAEGAKLASAVKRFKLAGKFNVSEAKTAAQREARDQIKGYIRELIGAR